MEYIFRDYLSLWKSSYQHQRVNGIINKWCDSMKIFLLKLCLLKTLFSLQNHKKIFKVVTGQISKSFWSLESLCDFWSKNSSNSYLFRLFDVFMTRSNCCSLKRRKSFKNCNYVEDKKVTDNLLKTTPKLLNFITKFSIDCVAFSS